MKEREKKKKLQITDRNLAGKLSQQRSLRNILFKLNKCLFVRNATTDSEGHFPVSVFFFFFTFHAFCHLVCAQLVVRFRTVISSSFICNHFPLLFSFSLHVSQLLSLVMSLSRRESLGYQCSASDRKRMINKLSCFSSPLYIPPFFSETRTPAAPNDISPHSTPPPHHPSFPSLLPCRGWQGVTGV